MESILKGFLFLIQEWQGILSILAILSIGGWIIVVYVSVTFGRRLAFSEYITLGIGGGLLALFTGILLTVLLRYLFGLTINLFAICLGILLISGFASFWLKRHQYLAFELDLAPTLALTILLLLSIVIRLAFISGLFVPLYFDSAMHYSISKDLIGNFETSTLPLYSSFVGGYYHLGFHVLVAALSLSFGMDVKDVILILGQIILAFIPLPIFFIIKRETKLNIPALFATVLAGWGWALPAYAINWGKYPALTSILAFEFIICCFYLLLQTSKQYRWNLAPLLGISVLVTTFIHTRSLILVAAALISNALALAWDKSSRILRIVSFCLIISGLATLMTMASFKPILNMAFKPYQTEGLKITLLVLSLTPFAIKEFSRATFSAITFLLLVFGSLFVSVSRFLPMYDVQTLLDRPYAEMIFFLPLAFLGGLGYAGMIKTLQRINFWQGLKQKWFQSLLVVLLFGAVCANINHSSFFPSNCCNFFSNDDAIALDWMNKNISQNANILIAASQAIVFENTPTIQFAGSDAGVWVTPLIRRNSTLFPYTTDFSSQTTFNQLCNRGITHIYVGAKGANFTDVQIKTKPVWYENLLQLPKAKVYKLIGCP